jgi:molybdate transport system substrate-binding protein
LFSRSSTARSAIVAGAFLIITLATLALAGCAGKPDAAAVDGRVELTISAAASLTDALKDIQADYESAHPQTKLYFNFGASGALEQQIEQGAPVDVFLSASAQYMERLVSQQLVDARQQTNLLSNELVVIVPSGHKSEISMLADLTKPGIHHIAIGIPQAVPAGEYAMDALKSAGVWDSLLSRLVQGKDVRQVLAYVETGNADAGFVYRTDAAASAKVEIAFPFDPQTYPPIVYPMGIVQSTKHRKEATEFYTYLQQSAPRVIFNKYGFQVLK